MTTAPITGWSPWTGGGGYGLLVTGTIMIDRAYLAEPAHVAIEDDRALPQLLEWTKADFVLEALEFLVD